MKKWNTVFAFLRGYDVDVSGTEDEMTIANPANGNVIRVIDESAPAGEAPSERYEEYIVEFATQHRHFVDREDAIDYVRELMEDETLPLEFFLDGKRRFGGDIPRAEMPLLSQSRLAERFLLPPEQIAAYQFEIYSWSEKYDAPRTPVASLPK